MPTRITPDTATLIDHIYYYEGRGVTRGNLEVYSGNFVSDLIDHLPNYMLLVNKKKINTKEQRPYVRLYSDKSKRNFVADIKNIDWSTIYCQDNPNSAYDNFINNIEKCYEKCFPLRQLSRKRNKDKPWITSGLKRSSLIKNKLYKKWISTVA